MLPPASPLALLFFSSFIRLHPPPLQRRRLSWCCNGVRLINADSKVFLGFYEISAVARRRAHGGTVCRGICGPEGSCASAMRRGEIRHSKLQQTQRQSVFDETKKPTHLILSKAGQRNMVADGRKDVNQTAGGHCG